MNENQKRLFIAGGSILILLLLFLLWQIYLPTNSFLSRKPSPTPERLGDVGMITHYRMQLSDDTYLAYGVVQPDDYKPGEQVPVLLALPPGPQTQDMVEAGVSGYWGQEALNRGWVVVSPIAPDGRLFFQGSEQYIPEFLDNIEFLYPPEGGKFHLAGISNGGISAFRVATANPERFHDLVALPGLARTQDFERLDQLTDIPVTLFVGELDTTWVEPMQQIASRLEALGGEVYLEVLPGESHVIQSLAGGERLFDIMEANR